MSNRDKPEDDNPLPRPQPAGEPSSSSGVRAPRAPSVRSNLNRSWAWTVNKEIYIYIYKYIDSIMKYTLTDLHLQYTVHLLLLGKGKG